MKENEEIAALMNAKIKSVSPVKILGSYSQGSNKFIYDVCLELHKRGSVTQYATFKLHESGNYLQQIVFISPGDTSTALGPGGLSSKQSSFMPPSVIESQGLRNSIEQVVD